MENLINIKSNWKHCTLEYLIKKYDASQDMSRAAVFEREVYAAKEVSDWKCIHRILFDLRKEEDAPIFTGMQAKYSDDTAQMLETVKEDILVQLKDSIKILQTQYLIQLLQANYLEKLKQKRIKIENDTTLEEENVDLPGMASIFTELMLTNKESDELKNIRKILVDWKNSITKSKYRYKVMEWNINQATNKNGTNKLPNLLMKEIIIQNPDILILTEFSFCENASEFFKKVFDERNYDYYPKEKTKNTKNKQNEILIAWRRELFDLCLDKCMYSVVTFENNKPNFLLVDLIEKKTRQELVVAGVRITMAENIPVKGTEDEKKKAYQKQANKRYKQMQYVYKQLEKFARVIMGGDFNNYRRRTELKDWNIGRILCDNQEYKIYTPKGQSIKEKKSIRGVEYEFAEDHFVTKNCEIDNEVYDRCFVFRDEKYINGEDLSDWNYLSGYPDHAILIADLLL